MEIVDITYPAEWDWSSLSDCASTQLENDVMEYVFYNYVTGGSRDKMVTIRCTGANLPRNTYTAPEEMSKLLKEFYPEYQI